MKKRRFSEEQMVAILRTPSPSERTTFPSFTTEMASPGTFQSRMAALTWASKPADGTV
ncbi:hypothetical protein JGU66_34600 [Myxococcaceae bacterium JPH2]|nr:hypothetical protein [Myxococcaceae bacterium JPH2]